MTDREMTLIIAEKVMGWEWGVMLGSTWEGWFEASPADGIHPRSGPAVASFSPLSFDGDCMAAWDKFSEDAVVVQLTRLGDGGWNAWRSDGNISACHTDRRRAMCECMVKAMA